MRAIKIDPYDRTVEAIDFPDERNTPLADVLGSKEHYEVDFFDDHVLIVGKDWRDDTRPGFIIQDLQSIAGVALLVGKARDTWTDATQDPDAVSRGIRWKAPAQ